MHMNGRYDVPHANIFIGCGSVAYQAKQLLKQDFRRRSFLVAPTFGMPVHPDGACLFTAYAYGCELCGCRGRCAVPPALRLSRRGESASVGCAGADLSERGLRRVGRSELIVALAKRRAVHSQRAGMVFSNGQSLVRTNARNGLSMPLPAPAYQSHLLSQAATVSAARLNINEGCVPRRRSAGILVPSPADRDAIGVERAGVAFACIHLHKSSFGRIHIAVAVIAPAENCFVIPQSTSKLPT